jgi:hypothetical protein
MRIETEGWQAAADTIARRAFEEAARVATWRGEVWNRNDEGKSAAYQEGIEAASAEIARRIRDLMPQAPGLPHADKSYLFWMTQEFGLEVTEQEIAYRAELLARVAMMWWTWGQAWDGPESPNPPALLHNYVGGDLVRIAQRIAHTDDDAKMMRQMEEIVRYLGVRQVRAAEILLDSFRREPMPEVP